MNCRRNIVKTEQAKVADRLEPKGMWDGRIIIHWVRADNVPPVQRQVLTPAYVTQAEHGKPVVPPKQLGKRSVRKADGTAGKGLEKKRMPFCNGTDTG